MDDLEKIRVENIQRKTFLLRRQGLDWVAVASKISEKFDKKITSSQAQEIYDKYTSRTNVALDSRRNARKEAFQANDEWAKEMKELLNNIKEKALKHLELADKILIDQYEEENTKAYFKNLPVAISLFRSLLDQANFLGRRLEKIEINQNNYILNETQILQLVNKKMVQREKEQGYTIHPGTGEIIPLKKKKKILA